MFRFIRPLCLLICCLAPAIIFFSACGSSDTPGPTKTPGVTDTEIKFGTHIPLSQNPAAAYAPIAYGIRAYFDYVNAEQGGVHGRKLTLVIGDDHYNPADTVEVVRELVEKEGIFAMIGGLGEATHNAVWKYLEERGVPDMFLATGLSKWTDPVVRTRFAGNPDYLSEGRLLGKYIADNYDGKKVGFLLQNDEFGKEGERGFRLGLEGSNVEVVAVEQYESIQADVSAQVGRLKNAGVEVIGAYTIPPQGASLVKTAREVLDWDVPIIVTGVDCSDIFIALAGAENAEGIVSVVFGPQVYQTDNPAIQKHLEIMEKYGQGIPASNFSLFGQFVAEIAVHILEKAGPDLTRDSFLDSAESVTDFWCSTCVGLGPINMSPTDHRPIEVEMYNRVENGKWVAFGEPISFETTQR